jgi:RHS repeat-associated protein
MTTMVDPYGNTTEFTYIPGTSRIAAITDPLGNVSSMEYDDLGNMISSVDPFNNETNFSYDTHGNLTTITNANNVTSYMDYDSSGNITEITNANGDKTLMTYNVVGKTTSITDALGNVTKMEYEPIVGCGPCRGSNFIKVKSITDPENNTFQFVYDETGNLIKTINPKGIEISYEYSTNREVTKITDPLDRATTFEYDSLGNLVKTIDKRGNSTSYTYNELNRVTQVTYPNGASQQFVYDAGGSLIKTVDPLGNITRNIYDIGGRLIKTVDASGNTTEISYTVLGEIDSITDANGVISSFVYEKGLRLLKVVDALNGEISYEYDNLNNVSSISDQLGRKVTYKYDQLNRLIKIISDMGKERSFSYDSLGNVISQVDPKGQETRFIYSPSGRVNSILYADGREVSYEYDTLGNRTKMVDWIGETSYKYDDFSRMKRIVTPDNRTLKYSYNNLDELSKITLFGDGIYGTLKWKYSYDNYGRLESIKDPQENETSYSYDIAGRLVESVLPNAVKKVLSYDKNSNLLSMIYEDYRGREVDSFSYTYDAVGNRLAMEEPEGITRYSYDDKYQLTKAEKFERPRSWRLFDRLSQLLGKSKCPRAGVLQEKLDYLVNNLKKDYSIAYNYDAVGNRTQKLVDASSSLKELKSGSYDYFYDNDNRLIEEGYQKASPGWGNSWGSCLSWQGKGNKHGGAGHGKVHEEITNYIYDLNGNLLEQKQGRDVSKFSYDASDNMIMADVPGKKPVAFTFNGDGQRIARFFRDKGHHHGWSRGRSDDDDSEPAQWWRKKPKPKWKLDTSFFYSGPEILAEFDSKGKLDASYTAGPGIDNLISVTRHNSKTGRNRPVSYFYASDALGSVRQIMDDRGRGVNSYSYTPFGVAYNVHEKVEQPYRYTGRRWDPNVGKLWYRSRHYAPGVGRFSQADKYVRSEVNTVMYKSFEYTRNNPIVYYDPFGYSGVNTFNQWINFGNALMAGDDYDKFANQACKNEERLALSVSTTAYFELGLQSRTMDEQHELFKKINNISGLSYIYSQIMSASSIDSIMETTEQAALVRSVSLKLGLSPLSSLMWLMDFESSYVDSSLKEKTSNIQKISSNFSVRENYSIGAYQIQEYSNFNKLVIKSEQAKTYSAMKGAMISNLSMFLPSSTITTVFNGVSFFYGLYNLNQPKEPSVWDYF